MNNLNKELYSLFNIRWDEERTDEEDDLLDEAANNLIEKYGWDAVFSELMTYLQTNCTSPENAVNAAHLIWGYGWYENHIPEPYKFLGFFYNAVDFETSKYDESDILDSLAITILPAQGYDSADLVKNPYYMPESDPQIIAAAKAWKNTL